MRHSQWSAAETAFLKQCLDKRYSRKQIARHFPDRSLLAIKAKVEWERRQRGQAIDRVKVADELIVERDRRANEYRTPAQIMMGDPPFSQSALGRHPGNGAD